ncbi:uncharacterized protein GGS22DRAFT_148006 [Annulohypoxylon maeteangense]|uniref:uncharacterized protein n=1 Tax=Annulohypoxylon maeteangense TaxID=1927788 RepID=UPI00200808D5|nr:uncharacterized protein GGS22DRAFT_148006 [Annulohypoxylon maeteangense]KAI0884901.1 hypothetical protein GGS22DRAFT_148006 [Annulohypoxylon maeteangense]
MEYVLEKPHGTHNLFELLTLKALLTFSTAKVLRGSSRVLPQIAVGTTILLFGSYLWSSHFASRTVNPDHNKITLETGEVIKGDTGGHGLRIVVFGGGDIATPNRASWRADGPTSSWTDILCLQLNCNPYVSFIPLTDDDGGAFVSNSLFEAALARTSTAGNDTTAGLDYSWLARNYPVPPHKDLLHQVEAFLASPMPLKPPRETLWIFNVGFWDIWSLSALPLKVATRLIETEAQHVLSQVEILYEEAHKNDSVAFSDYYTGMGLDTVHVIGEHSLPQAPFRVFIPKPFDISMTPGFDSVRFTPPPPHIQAEQLRNAAFLTKHWDKVIQNMLNEWTTLPDLEEKKANLNGVPIPPARREAISYDISSYIEELIIEYQLRNADLVDRNRLRSMAAAEGYTEIWKPCIQRNDVPSGNSSSAENATESDGWSVCNTPDEHLFQTEFTVSRRTIFEIGKRAAKLLKRHMEMDEEWVRKAQLPLSSLRRGPGGEPETRNS